MTTSAGDAWKAASLVKKYLDGIRGAIPLAAEQIEMMLRLVAASGVEIKRVLDLGAGGGAISLAVLDRFPGAHITLVDFSEAMLEQACGAVPAEQSRVILADLADPTWTANVEGPFDAIVSGYAIHHLVDDRKRGLYAEVFGLLRPRAIFINVEHVSSASDWLVHQFDEMLTDSLHAHQQAIGSGLTRDEVASEYVHRPDKHANILAPVDDQCAWLRDAGFQDVDCYFKVLELAVFGGRKPTG